MSMRCVSLRERAVSAITLLSFSLTTISPSLAWAAGREEIEPDSTAERVVDAVSSKDLAADRGKPDVALPDLEVETAPSSKELPAKEVLNGAARQPVDKTPVLDAAAQSPSVQTAALPTGGDKSGVTSQAISVPKGSGTIQGMGESFSAQLSTGIATFSVPFALPAARGGAQPSLGLSYSSASGAGLAGMGWSVGVPYIARQTDRGLPGFNEGSEWNPNQDRFVFNGGQELVPICKVLSETSCESPAPESKNQLIVGEKMPLWAVGSQYFRPRVEGSFLRFFWSVDHRTWRVQNKSGVTMELGVPLDGSGDTNALEVNPDANKQIFRWHLVRQYDTYGGANPASASISPTPFNVVVYKYFQNGGQAYLSDIYDTTPAATPSTTTVSTYAHHTHLDYEDRTDPTESYRSGWLIKQTKRLKRVDVASKTFTSGISGNRQLVRRYHLAYDGLFHTSYLSSVQVEGRCAVAENADNAEEEINGLLGDTNCGLLPPMTFDYSHVKGFNTAGTAVGSGLTGYEAFDARIKQIGGDPPHSVDEELTDYFDVNADGLPDVLVTAPGVYGNDYGVFFNSAGGVRDTFGAVSQLGVTGVLGANSGTIKLSNNNVMALDLDSDGIVDLLHMPKVKTYAAYRFTPPGPGSSKWMLVGSAIDVANKQSPKIDLGRDAAETRVVDVNFDGMVDLVVSTGTEFQTFLGLGRLPKGDAQFGHGNWKTADTSTLSNDAISNCVPYSGTPVRFSDSDIQLADMNGDGIQDIVRLRRGDLRYWPGRGNGFWGTGKLDDCPAGTFGDKRYLAMDSAPYYSDIQGESLRMDDVNGDGLEDLVQVRFDAVDVWLNVDGKGWTKRYILDGTTASPSYANRVRLMDINGSGTRDIVWGNGKKYEYIDLAGGERPGMLVQVKNGLGKSTDIEYSSSTAEMLAADRTGVECTGDATLFESAWCNRMPTVTHLVKRVTESDNLSVAGSGISHYVTEFSYRDPVYDGRQREFRGFRRARSKRLGDANSPTDLSESTFLLGECEDEDTNDSFDPCKQSERWADNPREALKGLPIVTERFDEQGRYLSTEAKTYRLRQLYGGLDGRVVRHAFESGKRTTLYDTAAAFTAQESLSLPVVEDQPAPASATADISSAVCSSTVTAEPLRNTHTYKVPVRAVPAAVITSSSRVDAVGNRLISVANGCIVGSECPLNGEASTVGLAAEETICAFTSTGLVPGNNTGWLYRTITSWSQGTADTVQRSKTTTSYTPEGAPSGASATLSGTIALERSVASYPSRIKAPDPATRSTNGTISLGAKTYNGLGNLTRETGPNGRCRDISYEATLEGLGYAQLPTSELTYVDGCPPPGIPPDSALVTTAMYDRALALVTTVVDMSRQTSTVQYDQFGRLTVLYRPRTLAGAAPATPVPSVKIDYDLPASGSARTYSVIHSQTLDGADEDQADEDDYLQSYSYVDGMGRARVGLAEADPEANEDGHRYLVSAIVELDAKGAVRRKYLPYFGDPDPSTFPVSDAPPATQYGRQRYDAFGRQLQTFDVDGTVTLQIRYHALKTDLYDAADLYPGPHQGSYVTVRSDGFGRTIATTERVHVNGVLEMREVRTKYLASGHPQVITRLNLATGEKLVRWMAYDSLGRMVMNVDPHATVGFSETPSSAAGLMTWHYVYDDAGDLVGTSDARGCGQNFVYDGAGRLRAEDYSPCLKAHADYVPPVLSSGANYEVVYEYDNGTSGVVTKPNYASGDPHYYSESTDDLRGRLRAVHDRAATTWFKYDARGRTVTTYRKVSYIGAPQNPIASRYVDHWYVKDFKYDGSDRSVEETTGAVTSELLASDGTSVVKTSYTKRGTLRNVDSSYGMLVSNIQRSGDGLVQSMTLGDAASTTTAMRYDTRRRLSSVQTFRRAANLWSTEPPSITPVPAVEPPDPTRQLLLQDLDYSYDVVGNPIEIRDWRIVEEWPDGAKPATRRMEYDDLNRVTRVDYEYPGGFDKFTSPYAAELNGQTEPRRPVPRGHKLLSKRPLWQTYKFDWLGNTANTDDDQHVFYDRSLGAITNNTAQGRPYQLAGASQAQSGGTQNGYLKGGAGYDAAGNLTAVTVSQSTTACTTELSACFSRFFYDWDEVGRLTEARRVEGEGPNATGPILDYLYDANNERVLKQHFFNGIGGVNTPKLTTAYVFNSLELRRAPFDSVTKQYLVDATTEVPYLSANGMRLARLHHEPPAKGEPKLATPDAKHSSDLHILLNLPDHLGSSSLIIDHATGEVVEARTYQPYGATESDYRPDRWKGFRDDYGFTYKEEDVEVGLQYFGRRYLSPYLGRWISADPLGLHGLSADLNLYAYVRGAVMKSIDPLGLDGTPVDDLPPSPENAGLSQFMNDEGQVEITEVVISPWTAAPEKVTPPPAPSGPPPITCPRGCHGYTGIYDDKTGLTSYGHHGGVPVQENIDPLLPVKVPANIAANLVRAWLPFGLALPELAEAVVPRAEYGPGAGAAGALEIVGTLVAPFALKELPSLRGMRIYGSPDLLAGNRLVIVNPEFTPNFGSVLYNETQTSIAALSDNPSLFNVLLSPEEILQTAEDPSSYARNYGKAVERLTARSVQANPLHGSWLEYSGGGAYVPDFFGTGPASGLTFDITTFKQVGTKFPGGIPKYSNVIVIPYERPQ
jgi:RHS repeat-associated protein